MMRIFNTIRLFLTVFLFSCFSPFTQALSISVDMDTIRNPSGAWQDDVQIGSGFNLISVDNGDITKLESDTYIYFYSYTSDGEPIWLLSEKPLGKIYPNVPQRVNMLYYEQNKPDHPTVFAELEISFSGCHAGSAVLRTQGGQTIHYRNLKPTFNIEASCTPPGELYPLRESTKQKGLLNPAGAWFQSDKPGSGIHLIHSEDYGNFTYFFGYDANGNHLWLLNRDRFDSFRRGQRQTQDMLRYSFKNSKLNADYWGRLTLQFDHCEQGQAILQSADGLIHMYFNPMQRLAAVLGACQPGLDDYEEPFQPTGHITLSAMNGENIAALYCDPLSPAPGQYVNCHVETPYQHSEVDWQFSVPGVSCIHKPSPNACVFIAPPSDLIISTAIGRPATIPTPNPPAEQNQVASYPKIAGIAEIEAAINAIRAQGRYCGPSFYPATQPISFNRILETAAIKHSKDMIARRFFDHLNPDGENFEDRVAKEDYQYRYVNENIVVGSGDLRNSVDKALQAWLESPRHCRNLMSPDITEFGLGWAKGIWYYEGKSYPDGFFWTFVGAAPR